jgi:cytochrome c
VKDSHIKVAGAILFTLLAIWVIRVVPNHLFGSEGEEAAVKEPAPAAEAPAPVAEKPAEAKKEEAPAAAPAPAPTAAAGSGDPAAGEKIYKAHLCFACHSFTAGKHGAGPSLHAVFGRGAGEAEGFAYSGELKASGIVWNEESLDKWVQGPQKLVTGTKMVLAKPVADAGDRANLIAYIKQESSK